MVEVFWGGDGCWGVGGGIEPLRSEVTLSSYNMKAIASIIRENTAVFPANC